VAPHWRNGAIGNAKWAGVRVRDLLADCGLDVDGMALGRVSHELLCAFSFFHLLATNSSTRSALTSLLVINQVSHDSVRMVNFIGEDTDETGVPCELDFI